MTTTSSARARVEAFLSRRSRMRGIDHHVISSLDGDAIQLTAADLRSLLEQRPARSKTNMRHGDWEILGEALAYYIALLETRIEDEKSDDSAARYSAAYRQAVKTQRKVHEREIDTYPEKEASDGTERPVQHPPHA